jgi:hypothetical protein
MVGGGVPVSTCDDSSCTGFLRCQNFENTGYDNSETWSEGGGGTVDEDEASTVLRGSQSLQIIYDTSTTYAQNQLASGQTEIYLHFLFRCDDLPTGTRTILKGYSAGVTGLFNIYLLSNGTLRMVVGGADLTTTDAISADTNYRIWAYFHDASGAGNDGQAWIEFTSTASTAPTGSGNKRVSTTTHTDQDDWLYTRFNADEGTMFFDQFLMKTTAFSKVCE